MSDRARWTLITGVLATLLAITIWLVFTDAAFVKTAIRLYRDKKFLKETVTSWGWMAPVVFIMIQALQVIISPIPGEVTGPVGGALFGTAWGLFYSSIGLTLGTLFCFWVGRMWGEPLIRPWLSEHNWNRMNFILEAEGAIICFVLYVVPGFPKDITSYLFGISPMPFWLFAIVSTLGRLPGTWISSYFGASVADHQYLYALVFISLVAAVGLPIFYYRDRIMRGLQDRLRRKKELLERKKGRRGQAHDRGSA
jgi:uncharacterized membrane protein YdjX (TVP38/TMEM64 family)